MTPIRITSPGGIIPRLSARQLPDGAAQVAANVSVLPGEWRPLRKPKLRWQPTLSPDPLQSIFRMDDTTWFAWAVQHVRVERAPIEGEQRYVVSGDGIPKMITKALASPASASGLPAAARALGIPSPQTVPSVAHSGGVSATTVSRSYCYTFVSDWEEESSPSPVSALVTGKVDDTWAITAMDPTPPNSGSITGATKTATTVTLQTGAKHFLRVGDTTTIAAVLGMTDVNGVRVVTAVPDATHYTVALVTAQTYTGGGTWARTVPWGPCTKRLYRTTSGVTGDMQLVAEGITATSYNDTLTDLQIIGDSLVSDGWVPPPTDLTGIVSMPNGMLAGFVGGGRTVWFCEPFQPHAWPERYRRVLSDDVVAVAAYGSVLGIATKGPPQLLSGIDPAAMTPTKHDKPFPCVSRASVCALADGVLYATRNGLVRMDLSGVGVFTEGLFMPEQWQALQPAAMTCAFDGSRLYISTPAENRLFTLDLVNGGAMVTAYQRLQCAHADPATGATFFALGTKVYEFDAFDSPPMAMDWMSREYVAATPFNLGAAKVETDVAYAETAVAALLAERADVIASNTVLMTSPLGGRGSINGRATNVLEINGSILDPLPDTEPTTSFTLYAGKGSSGEMKVVFSKVIPSAKAFSLPSGFKTDRFAVRIQSNGQVAAIVLADTHKALAGA